MIGLVDLDRDLIAHAFVFGVADYGDDFDVELGAGVAAHADVFSYGVAVFEKAPGEAFVHDADFGCAAAIGHAEIAAEQDRDVHGLEVVGRDELHVGVGGFGGF